MDYHKKVMLKDGRECLLRNGTEHDGETLLRVFVMTHSETDLMLTYPDECTFTAEEESEYLRKKTESANEIEILAEVDGKVVGSAGIEAIGDKFKLRHRCDFGICVEKAYWGRGIGQALLNACIECAKKAGYEQMELQVVADNDRALAMYRKAGFVEFGRNPRGFRSRISGYQELADMRLEL